MTEQFDVAGLGAGAVVVGVDASPSARVALAAALREGERRGVPVLAVTAFDPPDLWGLDSAGLVDVELVEREMRRVTTGIVDEVARDLRAAGTVVPEVRVEVAPGPAVSTLCLVARGAELLVVGHRGRGAVASRLIGSVGLGVVVHATCPVLIMRAGVPAAV
ncbi:universal stress protein [Actinomycetospora sp. OC33-EN08]|uniref:Universal stress protein n=1 Tax=Actinomycetospora aurantiaca TaxID=3129233 RepID=A0ABU8MFQ8_9PSEU